MTPLSRIEESRIDTSPYMSQMSTYALEPPTATIVCTPPSPQHPLRNSRSEPVLPLQAGLFGAFLPLPSFSTRRQDTNASISSSAHCSLFRDDLLHLPSASASSSTTDLSYISESSESSSIGLESRIFFRPTKPPSLLPIALQNNTASLTSDPPRQEGPSYPLSYHASYINTLPREPLPVLKRVDSPRRPTLITTSISSVNYPTEPITPISPTQDSSTSSEQTKGQSRMSNWLSHTGEDSTLLRLGTDEVPKTSASPERFSRAIIMQSSSSSYDMYPSTPGRASQSSPVGSHDLVTPPPSAALSGGFFFPSSAHNQDRELSAYPTSPRRQSLLITKVRSHSPVRAEPRTTAKRASNTLPRSFIMPESLLITTPSMNVASGTSSGRLQKTQDVPFVAHELPPPSRISERASSSHTSHPSLPNIPLTPIQGSPTVDESPEARSIRTPRPLERSRFSVDEETVRKLKGSRGSGLRERTMGFFEFGAGGIRKSTSLANDLGSSSDKKTTTHRRGLSLTHNVGEGSSYMDWAARAKSVRKKLASSPTKKASVLTSVENIMEEGILYDDGFASPRPAAQRTSILGMQWEHIELTPPAARAHQDDMAQILERHARAEVGSSNNPTNHVSFTSNSLWPASSTISPDLPSKQRFLASHSRTRSAAAAHTVNPKLGVSAPLLSSSSADSPLTTLLPTGQTHDATHPVTASALEAEPAQSLFFAGFALSPWFWLIGGWLLTPTGKIFTSSKSSHLKNVDALRSHRDDDLPRQPQEKPKTSSLPPKPLAPRPQAPKRWPTFKKNRSSKSQAGSLDVVIDISRDQHAQPNDQPGDMPSPDPSDVFARINQSWISDDNEGEEFGVRAASSQPQGACRPSSFSFTTSQSSLNLSLSEQSASPISLSIAHSFPCPPSSAQYPSSTWPMTNPPSRTAERHDLFSSPLSAHHPSRRGYSQHPLRHGFSRDDLHEASFRAKDRSGVRHQLSRFVPMRSDHPNPWVWRCRVAAIIAALVILGFSIVAIVLVAKSR